MSTASPRHRRVPSHPVPSAGARPDPGGVAGLSPPDPAPGSPDDGGPPGGGRGGLLTRIDALADLAGRRRGLILTSSGTLAEGEVRSIARVAGLSGTRPRGEVALLAALAIGVGLLRVRGARLEPTGLHPAWRHLNAGLQAGIVYAAWCHRVPWPPLLGRAPAVGQLHLARLDVLRFLLGLPAGVDVRLPALSRTVAELAGLPPGPPPVTLTTAGFLEPLAALGAADLDPPPPARPRTLRLRAGAGTVIGSALIAAGEDVLLPPDPAS